MKRIALSVRSREPEAGEDLAPPQTLMYDTPGRPDPPHQTHPAVRWAIIVIVVTIAVLAVWLPFFLKACCDIIGNDPHAGPNG